MSWFKYGESKPSCRVGIWLRVYHLREDPALGPAIKKYGNGIPWMARISERRASDSSVVVEMWFRTITDTIVKFKINTENDTNVVGVNKVVQVRTKENPEWTCEGDLGRALKMGDKILKQR